MRNLGWAVPISAKTSPSLHTLRALPPFPPVAAKLMNLLRQENVDFRHAVELMKLDPSITTEVLRLANSASSGSRFPTTSLLQALSVLGVSRIVSLATTLCVGQLVKRLAKLPVMNRCWRHNLATALIASKGSQSCGVDSAKAYTFGLLAGIGRLALLSSNPEMYSHLVTRAANERMPLEMLEEELFGFDHREAGAWLVREWRLPDELNNVLFSRSPADGPDCRFARLIREAGSEADRLGFGVLDVIPSQPPDPSFFEIAGRVNQIEQDLAM